MSTDLIHTIGAVAVGVFAFVWGVTHNDSALYGTGLIVLGFEGVGKVS